MSAVSMRELIDAGVHFGHQTRDWAPAMSPYIFGARQKIHIINLEKTVPMLDEALNFLGKLASKNKKVLFVGTKRQARKIVAEQATACGMPYVNYRWLGGMLTNHRTVRKSVERLLDLDEVIEKGSLGQLGQREVQKVYREHEKLERSVGGIRKLKGLPDALFVIDTGYEQIAIMEARKLGIPVVGVVDSNNQPRDVDYVIPGNDDSIRAIKLYTEAASRAIREAGNLGQGAGAVDSEDFVEVSDTDGA